jgi:hypothetical protein
MTSSTLVRYCNFEFRIDFAKLLNVSHSKSGWQLALRTHPPVRWTEHRLRHTTQQRPPLHRLCFVVQPWPTLLQFISFGCCRPSLRGWIRGVRVRGGKRWLRLCRAGWVELLWIGALRVLVGLGELALKAFYGAACTLTPVVVNKASSQ